jgi:hypothetical protein
MASQRKTSISGLNYFEGDKDGSHVDNGFMGTARRGSVVKEIPKDNNVVTASDDIIRRASVTNPDFGGLSADSKDATDYETTMSVRTALKLYKKGVLWSLLMSTAIIMEGYDVVLLANFYGLPAFSMCAHPLDNELNPLTPYRC